ncbi:MAG: DUF86 domain-containing protein [Alphaproteobacteria bacterium]
MPSKAPDRRFRDIVENVERIERYTANMTENDFAKSEVVQDAVERCLSRISEAATKLGDVAEQLCDDQPWAQIRGFGNHLRHGYDNLDPEVVWATIVDDLPPLKVACLNALAKLGSMQ